MLLGGCGSSEAQPPAHGALRTLGAAPLCEASALEEVQGGYLVADNEVHQSLFLFTDRGGQLVDPREVELPRRQRPHDIEALAISQDTLLVVGSHSRKRDCESSPSRQSLLWARWSGGTLAPIAFHDDAPVPADATACLQRFFVSPAPEGAREVCAAIAEAEARAARGDCGATLDIEGAAAIDGRFWLGLRAPLVRGRAVLLRVAGVGALRADLVRTVDLGGRGIRSLTAHDGELWGIAGPSDDARAPHRLFRAPAAGEAILSAELPASSEGLVIRGGRAWVVIDGARGQPVCDEPSRQHRVPITAQSGTSPPTQSGR